MHKVGKIDIEIYKNVCDGTIVSEDVIITDNRIEHIIDRRGQEFYDRYSGIFGDIIEDPDYIFKDIHKNTALVCKTITDDDKSINIVLKLMVKEDASDYKHSIITVISESEKRFAQRLRNNIPVYKKI